MLLNSRGMNIFLLKHNMKKNPTLLLMPDAQNHHIYHKRSYNESKDEELQSNVYRVKIQKRYGNYDNKESEINNERIGYCTNFGGKSILNDLNNDFEGLEYDQKYISNLDSLKDVASEEIKALMKIEANSCEQIFSPPNSPSKDILQILKEEAEKEVQKLNKTAKEIKSSQENIIVSSQELCASAESDLKSFNDFNDDIFEFNSVTKRYRCPIENCYKEFPSLSRIKRHYIIHTDIKPFKCENPECSKTFSRKDNMLQHYRVHCPYTTDLPKRFYGK